MTTGLCLVRRSLIPYEKFSVKVKCKSVLTKGYNIKIYKQDKSYKNKKETHEVKIWRKEGIDNERLKKFELNKDKSK